MAAPRGGYRVDAREVRGRLVDSRRPTRLPEDPVIDALEPYLASLVVGLAAVVVLLLVLVLWQARRVGRLSRRLDGLTRGADGASLESVLGAHLQRVAAVAREVERVGERTGTLEADAPHALRHVGLVRFNPFEDTGGNQSFALAILDANGDGIVLSSLHARGGTRIYAKALAGGRSEAALSDEETEAVRLARTTPGDRRA